MTTERRIMLTIVTSPDGTKCAAECPHHEYYYACEMPDDDDGPSGFVCYAFDPDGRDLRKLDVRHPACIAAESAAREAEVDALQRGFDLRDERTADDMDDDFAPHALAHLIEHILRGES